MSEFFSKRLAQAIAKSSKNQVEIAKIVGIAPPYLSDLKRGNRSNPSSEVVKRLAEVLEVPISWLLAEESPSANYSEPQSIVKEDSPSYGSPPTYLNELVKLAASADIVSILQTMEQISKSAAAGNLDASHAIAQMIPIVRSRLESQTAPP